MVEEHKNQSINLCALLSFVIAGLASLIHLAYFLKHLGGLSENAGRRMSEDAMEFGIIGVVALLPMTILGLILAAFGGAHRKTALVAQGVSLALGIGLLVFYEVSICCWRWPWFSQC